MRSTLERLIELVTQAHQIAESGASREMIETIIFGKIKPQVDGLCLNIAWENPGPYVDKMHRVQSYLCALDDAKADAQKILAALGDDDRGW